MPNTLTLAALLTGALFLWTHEGPDTPLALEAETRGHKLAVTWSNGVLSHEPYAELAACELEAKRMTQLHAVTGASCS